MPQPSTNGGPRGRLSRDRVLAAAVALADSGGIESLTMRRLGEDLGVEAMSLYRHVANKEDLLDGMVDLVFGELELPADGSDWRTAMRDRATSTRAALNRHPWATPLMQSRTTPGGHAPTPRHRHRHAARGGLLRRPRCPCLLGAGQLHLRIRPAG